MQKRNLQVGVLGIFALVVSAGLAYGETYFVRRDGSDANTGLANTAADAWLTIANAANRVSSGDVVRVQAGTYSERIMLTVSGTLGNPITFVADGVVTFCGMNVSGKNYVRIIGFTIDTDAGGCTMANRAINVTGTNTGLEFWNNTIREANSGGIGGGSYADRQHNSLVIGNTFVSIGAPSVAVGLRGNDNLLAYNEVVSPSPDAFVVDGSRSYWLNNYIREPSDAAGHSDVFQAGSSSLGLSNNLFEANFIVGTGSLAHEHGALFQNHSVVSCSTGTCAVMTENLFRYNVWHNISGGAIGVDLPTIGPLTNTRLVHDTVVDVQRTAPSATNGLVFNGSGITAYVYNTLHYRAWGANVSSNVRGFLATNGASITAAEYNLAYDPTGSVTFTTPWTSQANELSNVNPVFTDVAHDDFTLQAGSGARNAGGALTTTSGSGTGTTFNVASGGGGWFRGPNSNISQYGGNLTAGDIITVGTTTRTVSSVVGDAITVTSPFTWAHGDSVYLGTSTAPDIGAYPYRPGGYQLTATYAMSGGIATITPSDGRLVRFVVCYQDGIPTTVDNSSPYTCSAGTGSLEVRVYPRYASKARFVSATMGPRAPTNLRIVGGEIQN